MMQTLALFVVATQLVHAQEVAAPVPAPAPAPGMETEEPVVDAAICPPFLATVGTASLAVCTTQFGLCNADTDCQLFIAAILGGMVPTCGLNLPFDQCFTDIGADIMSEGFFLAIDLGACVVCCNDDSYWPADFEFNGAPYVSECFCREPAAEVLEADADAECVIPFFYNGVWNRDCIEVGDNNVEMCGTELIVASEDDLVACAEMNDDVPLDTCTFPDLRATADDDDDDDMSTEAPIIDSAASVALSSLVIAGGVTVAYLLQ